MQDADAGDPAARQATIALARIASIAGHPMLLVPLAIALAMRGRVSVDEGVSIFAMVALAIVVVGVYLVHGVRTGRLSHVDVSKREERGTFYRVAILATAGAAIALYFSAVPRAAVFGTGCASALLGVSSIVNLKLKTSLHTSFAVVAAGVVGVGAGVTFIAFALAAAAVAWSRVTLGRHTRLEVAVGAALGLVAALALGVVRTL